MSRTDLDHGAADRRYWVDLAERIARPVLSAAAEGRLRAKMPVRSKKPDYCGARVPLEPIGRALLGLTPWLAADGGDQHEQQVRGELRDLAVGAINHLSDPDSDDYAYKSCFFREHIVDAGIFAHALVRDDLMLWRRLNNATRHNVIELMRQARALHPHFNNWLLFSAMSETLLHRTGTDFDRMRVDYALRQHEQWYLGDGHYGDGPRFHCDYYNSFVIQPMLVDITATMQSVDETWRGYAEPMRQRAVRYAAVQERMISPEGALPPVGRSLVYRFGVLQVLGQMALQGELPQGVSPAQVRCGMTAAIRRMADAEGTFDADGWLNIGWAGHQPDVGELYISTGSCYLCTAGLLPLGLPADDPFWADAPQPWTSRKMYEGVDMPPDHAV